MSIPWLKEMQAANVPAAHTPEAFYLAAFPVVSSNVHGVCRNKL